MKRVELSLMVFTIMGLFSLSTLAVEGNAEKPAPQPDKATTTTIEPVKPEPGKLDKEKPTSIFGDLVVTIDGTIADLPKEMDPNVPVSITIVKGDVKTTVVLERPDVLKFKEITLTDGAKIGVAGWQVTEKDKKFVKASDITLGDKKINLLSANGNKTWTDIDVATVVVLQGTVKNFVAPEAETTTPGTATKTTDNATITKTPDEKPVRTSPKSITFDLVTDKETIKIVELCPVGYALKNKLALANDQKVIITAKQRGAKGTLIFMKISIVGVENSELKLRDEKGNPIWMQRNNPKPKTEGGEKTKENPTPPVVEKKAA